MEEAELLFLECAIECSGNSDNWENLAVALMRSGNYNRAGKATSYPYTLRTLLSIPPIQINREHQAWDVQEGVDLPTTAPRLLFEPLFVWPRGTAGQRILKAFDFTRN